MLQGQNIQLNKLKAFTLKSSLILLPLLALPSITQAESFTAKRAGQGFTGLTQDFTSSLSNPALLTKYDDDDDVFFSLNVGLMVSDQYDVIDTAEDISDNLDILADDINGLQFQNFQSLLEVQNAYDDINQQVDNIITDLEKIDGKVIKARNGINLQIIIPNQYLSFGLFGNQYGQIGVLVDYDERDEQLLNNAVINGSLDLDDIQSAASGIGYSIAEAGIMAGYSAVNNESYELSFGAKLKYQRVDLFYNRSSISDFDDDDFDLTDDEYITDDSGANIDLGLYIAWGKERQWHAALVTNNLVEQEVHHVEQDLTFTLKASSSFGLSYQNDWVSLAAEVDLTDREKFESLTASKYAGVGAEFRLYEHLQLRVGYRTDLNDFDEDIYTAGVGISPWDVLSIDIAAFTGDNETIGAALQFGLKI